MTSHTTQCCYYGIHSFHSCVPLQADLTQGQLLALDNVMDVWKLT